jgi:hypothetical protein
MNPQALHIFADEDHVNLQDGANTIVPLVTICEGKQTVTKGRNTLIEPIHVHGYGINAQELWEYVYAICSEKYDMVRIQQIYIYGDGGNWIKAAFDIFPKAKYIFDEFHFVKRTRSLFSGEICRPYSFHTRSTITNNDKPLFRDMIKKMINAVEEKMQDGSEKNNKLKRIKEHRAFILKHWDAIQNANIPESIGSCTEAMVSHVLSERFSRNPMGWSKTGLSKMSMIRMFVLNGEKVMPIDTSAWKYDKKHHAVITKFDKYKNIVNKQRDEIFKDAKSWRWFEVDNLISGKVTGTSVALDALGKIRSIA